MHLIGYGLPPLYILWHSCIYHSVVYLASLGRMHLLMLCLAAVPSLYSLVCSFCNLLCLQCWAFWHIIRVYLCLHLEACSRDLTLNSHAMWRKVESRRGTHSSLLIQAHLENEKRKKEIKTKINPPSLSARPLWIQIPYTHNPSTNLALSI